MSKVSRKVRAEEARRGTIAADRRIIIKDKPELAMTLNEPAPEYVDPADALSAEDLATMPLRIGQLKTARARVWRSHSGAWYRHGGFLRIQPSKEGVRQYVILLAKGANQGDLDGLLAEVNRMRAGGRGARWKRLGHGWAKWADDRTFSFAYTSRPYADPYMTSDTAGRVTVCTEPLCVDQWHVEYDAHQLDSVSRELPKQRGRYDIRVSRCLDEVQWTVDVHAGDFYGTPEDVAVFVSDLQWMQEECRRANEAALQLVAAS